MKKLTKKGQEIMAEMARRKVRFHPNEEWDKINLWGLFSYGYIETYLNNGLLWQTTHLPKPEKKSYRVWAQPSKEAWEKYIKPLIEKHTLEELTLMAGWPPECSKD